MYQDIKIVRQLSVSEVFYVDYKISVQVVCELTGSLTPQILQTALNHVAKCHPLLSCHVVRDNDDLYFATSSVDIRVPLEVLPHIHNEHERDLIINKELNDALDESKNLIRVVLLERESSYTMIITLHHAIVDGLSSVQLMRSILEACGDIMASGSPQSGEILSVQPSIETLSSPLVSPDELSDYIQRFAQQAKMVPLQAIEPQPLNNEHDKTSVEVLHVKLSHEETQKLIQNCKARHVSLHSLIAAAHLIAIRQCLDDTDTELMLRCNTPVDLRQRLNPPLDNKHLLSAATGCGTNHAVSINTSLWDLAKEIGESIQEALDNRDVFKAHLTFMDTLMKHRMPNAVGISSVGRIDIPTTYNGIQCDGLYVTGVYQLPLFGVTAYTFDSQLVMTYLYVKPYYSLDLMLKIATLVGLVMDSQ